MASATKGIDVSKWQGTIDWTKVAADGISFVIIRAGYGSLASQKDSKFETNYAGAKAAGLAVGAYWYSYATTTAGAKNEAAACLSCIAGKTFDLPVYFDQEYEPGILALSNSARTNICKTFCDAIQDAGYTPGIYASTDFINNKLNYTALTDYSIWAAQYASECTCKADYDMWQYSSTGKVSGISGNVDMDYLYSTLTGGTGTTTDTTDTQKTYVKQFQTWLNTNYSAGLTVDGIQGTKTKAGACKALQTELNKQFSAGLTVDGIFGSKTKAACVNVKQGASGNLTRTIQGLLYGYGYDPNGFDGIFGSGCQSAVKSYQSDNGLSVDGIVGKNTWAKFFGA